MNEQKKKGVLLGAITGDAIGTPLDGISRAHLRSIFKSINDYTDAAPALKDKLENWRKPALYSAASQLMIFMAFFLILHKRPDPSGFLHYISGIPEGSGNEYGIFRHPTVMLRHIINSEKSALNTNGSTAFSIADASGAIVLIPLCLNNDKENQLENLLSLSANYNKEIFSVAGNVIFGTLLINVLSENHTSYPIDLIDLAIKTANDLLRQLENLSPKIFGLGLNPDYLSSSVRDYLNILMKINNIKDIDSAEKNIYSYLNTRIKTPATRATINHPMAVIPFSIYLCRFYSHNPSDMLFRTAEFGGSASVLCAMTGALSGALYGYESLPQNLLDGLVNKKRITTVIESILKDKITDQLAEDFVKSEASLSAKEMEEKSAKLKHAKVKVEKKKSRNEMEKELSSHVVESWTKFDRAKWRRKLDHEPDNR
jgi:hypothetical protein